MDAAEYKHIVLGLIFLKYISDAFEAKHAELAAATATEAPTAEDPDEYKAQSIFWVPREARWSTSRPRRPTPTIGSHRRRRHGRHSSARTPRSRASSQGLRPPRPGQGSPAITRIDHRLGSRRSRQRTSSPRVRVLSSPVRQRRGQEGRPVLHAQPRRPRARRDAGAGQRQARLRPLLRFPGGMFVSSEKFIEQHRGHIGDISIFGQESNSHLAPGQHEPRHPRHRRQHRPGRQASTPTPSRTSRRTTSWPIRPSTNSDWRGELLRNDKRWVYGHAARGQRQLRWVQHFISHLAPTGIGRLSCSRTAR